MNRPLVSVIMPTYNRAHLLGRAIQSVIDQTYEHFEFIIVDDASTDATPHIILEHKKKDGRIISIRNDTNLRIQKSLNSALRVSKGELIARIDDDDIWIDRNKLEKQVRFLEENSEYIIVGTGNIAVFQNKDLRMRSLKPETDRDIRQHMLLGCPFLHPSVVYRRSALDDVGPYDENLKQAEDYDLWMRFGKIGKMYNLPEYLIESWVGGDNVGHRKRREIIEVNLMLVKKYRGAYPHFFRAYIKNYLEYVDASFPVLRKVFWPIYKIRRILLNKFWPTAEIIKP